MKGSSLGYLLKTGFKNVYMNRLMSLASIGVLVACLMLIGGAVLLSLNMQVIVGAVEDAARAGGVKFIADILHNHANGLPVLPQQAAAGFAQRAVSQRVYRLHDPLLGGL